MRVSKVQIPDFFLALVVLGASREPTDKECEELRQQTISYWTKCLKKACPQNFERLDLHFTKSVFDGKKPEPRFNMYFEVSAEAEFSRTAPTVEDVFGVMIDSQSIDYLVEYVREVNPKSLFVTAIEVLAQRLKVDTKMPGGTVKAPTFSIAFVARDAHRDPTKKECEEYKKHTHKLIDTNLRKAYPDDFCSLQLNVLSVERGAEKPDARYNLYLENDASATFSHDPPTPMELFEIIKKCTSMEYMDSMQEIEESPFATVMMVKIQLVSLDEPLAPVPPPAPPTPPPAPPPEEGEGEEEDKDGEDDKVEEKDIVTVDASIFLAFCLMVEPPATPPAEKELAELQTMIHRFFYSLMQSEYPDGFVGLDLNATSTKHGAGIPEERFNMCVEYGAKVHFRADPSPPDAILLRMLIVECNLSSILAHVRTIETLCFSKATAVTMISERKKEVAPVRERSFAAAIPLLDPPKKAKQMPKQVKPKLLEPAKHAVKKLPKQIKLKPSEPVEAKQIKPKRLEPSKDLVMPTSLVTTEIKPKQSEPVEPKQIKPKIFKAKQMPKQVKPKLLQPPAKEAVKTMPKPIKLKPSEPVEAKQIKPKMLEPAKDLVKPTSLVTKSIKTKQSEPVESKQMKPKMLKAKQIPEQVKPKLLQPPAKTAVKTMPKPIKLKPSEPVEAKQTKPKMLEPAKELVKPPSLVTTEISDKPIRKEKTNVELKKESDHKKKPKKEKSKEPMKDPNTTPALMEGLNSPVGRTDVKYILVRSTEVSVAFTVIAEPTPQDYEKLRKKTYDFFVVRLNEIFPNQFVKLELQIGVADFGSEKADPKYNVYVEWDIEVNFTSSSTTTTVTGNKTIVPIDGNVPSPADMSRSLLVNVDYFGYLVKSVRTIEDSAFSDATAVHAYHSVRASYSRVK
jgi:methionine-rich copper-binding protein CopC